MRIVQDCRRARWMKRALSPRISSWWCHRSTALVPKRWKLCVAWSQSVSAVGSQDAGTESHRCIFVWAPIGVWHMFASGANKNDIVEARSKTDHKLIYCMNASRAFDASVFLVIRWPSVWLDTSSLRPSCSSPPAE